MSARAAAGRRQREVFSAMKWLSQHSLSGCAAARNRCVQCVHCDHLASYDKYPSLYNHLHRDSVSLQMASTFAELGREMIRERVKAGQARARVQPRAGAKAIGRPKVASATETEILAQLAAGIGKGKIARQLGVGVSTVQRVAKLLATPGEASPA